MWLLLLLAGCPASAPPPGVYRSGPNAIVRGVSAGELRVWGPDGTQMRVGTAGPNGTVLLGQSGPLWMFDHDVPAPPKALPVAATTVESAGFRMKDILREPGVQSAAPAAPDAAKSGGVYVRSVVKVRREHEPPVFVVTATGDDIGAGKFDGPADVRAGANCRAAVGLMDAKGERLFSSHLLEDATVTCAVPVVVPPVDVDGDGVLDVLIHGQNENKGFRAWFRMVGETLEPGPVDRWEGIP